MTAIFFDISSLSGLRRSTNSRRRAPFPGVGRAPGRAWRAPAHVHVHGAAAAVVVEAPYAAQQRVTGVGAARVSDEEGEQGVFQIGEVHRLAADLHLVGGQVHGHVVHGDVVGRTALVAGPQQLADAGGALGGARPVHDEVGLAGHRQAELGELVLVHDDEHGGGAFLGKRRLNGGHCAQSVAPRLVDDQIVARVRREQLLELNRRAGRHVHVQLREHLLELVGVIEAVRDEDYRFALHATTPPNCARAPTRSRCPGRPPIPRAWCARGNRGCARPRSRA